MTSTGTDTAATETGSVTHSAIEQAAARLAHAEVGRRPCPPVRDLIGRDDVTAAYAVQTIHHQRALAAGRQVSGRKIGLTAPAVQAQLGVDQPDFGFLYADMDVTTEARADSRVGGVGTGRLLQPKIEAEVAFVLGADLDSPGDDGEFSADALAAAVDSVVPALEIVDSRVSDWDISFGDTVADNASAGLYVLGDARVDPATFGSDLAAGLAQVDMTMTRRRDGWDDEVSIGAGRDCLGSPLAALGWLARTAHQHGEPLRAGQVVLAGALGAMTPVEPGDTFRAEISGVGAVSARFSTTEENR